MPRTFAADLLVLLRAKGVDIWTNGGHVISYKPDTAVSDTERELLQRHHWDVVTLLEAEQIARDAKKLRSKRTQVWLEHLPEHGYWLLCAGSTKSRAVATVLAEEERP